MIVKATHTALEVVILSIRLLVNDCQSYTHCPGGGDIINQTISK